LTFARADRGNATSNQALAHIGAETRDFSGTVRELSVSRAGRLADPYGAWPCRFPRTIQGICLADPSRLVRVNPARTRRDLTTSQ